MLELLGRIFAIDNPLWYYWPLIIIVGIVYKTMQHDELRAIVRGTVHFVLSMTVFMIVLGVFVFLLSEWA